MKHRGLSLKFFNCRVGTVSRQGFDQLQRWIFGSYFPFFPQKISQGSIAHTCTRMGYIIYMSISAIVIQK